MRPAGANRLWVWICVPRLTASACSMETRPSNGGSYDLVVIGGGSAGLTAARFAARLGRKVAIVEANRLGGDCTWTGCVPSKALVRAARARSDLKNSSRFGISAVEPEVEWPSIMSRIRSVIDEIYGAESPESLRNEGIDTFLAPAEFLNAHTVQVGETTISGKRFLIATGAAPSAPPIEGLQESGYLTYENICEIEQLPQRLLIVGAGPIGCELAQAFRRLGSQVALFEAADRILGQDEPEVSELIEKVLVSEGIELSIGQPVESIARVGKVVQVSLGKSTWTGNNLVVATGRIPKVTGLALEKAGILYSPKGISVDKYLRASQHHIYAAGDCTGGPQFTHYAGWQGFMAARNALLPGKTRAVRESIPWAVFTDPEVAHTGHTERTAIAQYGDSASVTTWPLKNTDRAVIDGAEEGFIKAVTLNNGKLLGATIVGARAGELIHEWALAIDRGLKLGELANTLHVYPTYSMATLQMAAEFSLSRLLTGFSGKVVRALSRIKV